MYRKSRPLISTFPSSVNWRQRSFRSAVLSNGAAGVSTPRHRSGVGRSGKRRLEHAPWDPDHAFVLADDDAELHGLPVRIPAGAA
jgi:hypothetical protein